MPTKKNTPKDWGKFNFSEAGIISVPHHEASVFEKAPSGPWPGNHRSPRGAFTLLGLDSIYQISL